MEPFDSLLQVAEQLLGPNGCSWDQKQTFLSLQPYVIEEAHEVVEAVDADDDEKMIEELGDLLYTIVFFGKLAEKMGRFSMEQIIQTVKEKLIRRHPHVFGDLKVKDTEEIIKNWEKIKAEEKGKKSSSEQKPPSTLPTLIRAQKILKQLMRIDSPLISQELAPPLSEKELAEAMMALIVRAEQNGLDAESALRRSLTRLEQA